MTRRAQYGGCDVDGLRTFDRARDCRLWSGFKVAISSLICASGSPVEDFLDSLEKFNLDQEQKRNWRFFAETALVGR